MGLLGSGLSRAYGGRLEMSPGCHLANQVTCKHYTKWLGVTASLLAVFVPSLPILTVASLQPRLQLTSRKQQQQQ